jgi:alpha-tubulin suppressor-like RCC1 family protein
LGACTAKFETRCPDGTVQTAGGGDVSDACSPIGGSGGAPNVGGSSGLGAGANGSSGVSGSGGGTMGAECSQGATKCTTDAQQTCGADGKWGTTTACDIACDGAGVACVVPVQLTVGGSHACARLSDGTVRCWGSDGFGQLGNGLGGDSALPTPVVGLAGAILIDSTDISSCATFAEGANAKVSCWGGNSFGESTVIQQDPVALTGLQGMKALGVAIDFLCIVRESGPPECMGSNNEGQLGNGGRVDSVNFGPTSPLPRAVTKLSLGGSAACALMADGTLACWGNGTYRLHTSTEGEPNGNDLLSPGVVAGVQDIRDIVMGNQNACAVGANNILHCWGGNFYGQLGRGTSTGVEGPGLVPYFTGVDRVAVGVYHICARKTDGSLWCWGRNDRGELGSACDTLGCSTTASGDSRYVASPAKTPINAVVDIGAGDQFTCALTEDAKVYCWGDNRSGQLGNGAVDDGGATPTAVRWK